MVSSTPDRKIKAILFDLDNTLYPAERDLFSLIDVRINRYMEEMVAIDRQDVDRLRRRYWQDYGTTLQGLILHHQVDPEEYLDYVHAVDVGSRLSFDRRLHEVLSGISIPSYVFTNGSRCHVDRVVSALGLDGLFHDVFDIRVDNYKPKPQPGPYQAVLNRLELAGEQCVMVEDQPQNLKTAKDFGMKTVLVGRADEHAEAGFIDVFIDGPADIGVAIAAWAGGCP